MSDPRPSSAQELKDVLELQKGGHAFLRYRDGTGGLRLIPLGEDLLHATIGRSARCDISLPWDAFASSVHAEIRKIGGEWTVADEGLSRNGTFLNSGRISGRQRLREGDTIRVGETIVAFHAAAYVGGQAPQTTSIASGDAQLMRVTETQRRVLLALCRPYKGQGGFVAPASNHTIGEEVFLSIDAVKGHLRALYAAFGIDALPQNQKRARLAELAFSRGVISDRDL